MDIVLAKLLPPGIVFLDEAIDSTRLANFFLEQEEPPPVLQRLTQSVSWTARPSSDEELASPPYAFFFREQEEPQPGWPRVQSILWTARPYSDEELASPPYQFFFLEQEDAWTGRTTAIIWTARPALDDDLFFTTTILDDEQPNVSAVQAIPWLSRPFLDEELASPPYKYFYLEQEDAWIAQVQRVAWLPRPALDDEITGAGLGFFFLEQEDSWPALVEKVTWTARPALDDELIFTATIVDDEQPFVTAVSAIPWLARPSLDDEISTNLANFFIDQEEPSFVRTTAIVWAARPFLDEDLYPTVTIFGIDEEQLPFTATQAIAWLPRPYSDEELAAPPYKYFFLEQEDAWTGRTTAIIWTARPFADDEISSTATIIDDEQCFVAAVQAVPWLPRPVLDDEITGAGLGNFHLEQEEGWFWRPRVEVVSWLARPVTDDEIGPSPVVFGPANVLIYDQCAGSDGDPVDGRTPDTIDIPGGTWSDPNAGFQILSNQIKCLSASQVLTTINAGTPNVSLSASINVTTVSLAGLVLRYVDDNNFLLAEVKNTAGIHNITIFKVVAGVSTQLAFHAATLVANTTYTLTFSADSNNLLTASILGTTITATDTAGSGNTRVGLYSISASGTVWDNFQAIGAFCLEDEEPAWPIPTVWAQPWTARPFTDDEIDFFVAGRLIIVELTVVDNADGTGALATISGSDIGSSNTILVQPYTGLPDSWLPGAVRTGDGTATLGTLGYQWAVVVGTSGNDLVLSNMVAFAATNNADAVQQRMSNALVARIQQLVMAMGINARVYNQIIEDDRVAQFPCIFVVFAGENEDDAGGLNDLDDVGYPFRVMIVDRNSENYQVPKGKYLLWRQQIARALRNQRLDGVSESILTKVRYSNIADKRLPAYQYFVSSLKVSCISREVRGLT